MQADTPCRFPHGKDRPWADQKIDATRKTMAMVAPFQVHCQSHPEETEDGIDTNKNQFEPGKIEVRWCKWPKSKWTCCCISHRAQLHWWTTTRDLSPQIPSTSAEHLAAGNLIQWEVKEAIAACEKMIKSCDVKIARLETEAECMKNVLHKCGIHQQHKDNASIPALTITPLKFWVHSQEWLNGQLIDKWEIHGQLVFDTSTKDWRTLMDKMEQINHWKTVDKITRCTYAPVTWKRNAEKLKKKR